MDTGNLIKSGNFFVLIIAGYALWRTCHWRSRSDLNYFTRQVICCWMFVFLGIAINRGWFAMSRFLSNSDSTWQSFMFEWRWLLVISTASIVGWGVVSFVEMIDEAQFWKKYCVFAVSAAAAFGLGFY